MLDEESKLDESHPERLQICERLDAVERRQLVAVDLQKFMGCDAESVRSKKNQNWPIHPERLQVCKRLDALERRQLVVADLQ